MSVRVYVNGEFLDKESAKISVFDHGFLYGDGVFEGIRAYSGIVFKLEEHLTRLYESAKTIFLDIPLSMDDMREAVLGTLRVNSLESAYIRLVVSRGTGDLGLDPRKCAKPTVICIADKIKLYPEEFYQKGLEVITSSTRRTPVDSLSGRVKSLNYLNNIMARIEANIAGAGEAIMLSHQGYVVECSADNIFCVISDRRILTPPVHLGALEGITRNAVIDIARARGYEVVQTAFTLHDVYNAKEVFLTGTGAELVSVVRADRRKIGDGLPGIVSRELREEFGRYVLTHGTPIGQNPMGSSTAKKVGSKVQQAVHKAV